MRIYLFDSQHCENRLHRPRRPKQMPSCTLRRRHIDPTGFPRTPLSTSHQSFNCHVLRHITQYRRGRMRVNIIHAPRLTLRMPQCHPHRPQRPPTIRQWGSQMMRISTRPVAYNFSVDLCASIPSVVELFQDHDPRALANDEAGAVAVEGSRSLSGDIVEGGGEAAGAAESADGEGVDAGFCATSDHDGGVAVGDEAAGVADGVGACGTGGCSGVVGALGMGGQLIEVRSGVEEEDTLNP